MKYPKIRFFKKVISPSICLCYAYFLLLFSLILLIMYEGATSSRAVKNLKLGSSQDSMSTCNATTNVDSSQLSRFVTELSCGPLFIHPSGRSTLRKDGRRERELLPGRFHSHV